MADLSNRRIQSATPVKFKQRSLYAATLKNRLDKVGCPFTESADVTWIVELCFKPGEPRIRILQWLFSKFHRQLYSVLDPIYSSSKADNRIKAILFVASALGLCQKNDLDLIEGNTSFKKQTVLFDRLLDLVLVIDRSEDPSKAPGSHFMLSESTDLREQFARDCKLLDSIPLQQSVEELFPPSLCLVPVDIRKSLEKEGYLDATERTELPNNMQLLTQKVMLIAEDLARQLDLLRQLQKEHCIQPSVAHASDSNTRERLLRKFKLVLGELQQMVVSFNHCYENNIQQWCNREPPKLSQLGDKIHTVHQMLEHFSVLIKSFDKIRDCHNRISSCAAPTDTSGGALTKSQATPTDTLYGAEIPHYRDKSSSILN